MKKFLMLLAIIPALSFAAQWERVGTFDDGTYRIWVPEGWVVKSISSTGVALAFVPDRAHSWVS